MAAPMDALTILSCCLLFLISSSYASLFNKRFEYKYSFKGPHLVQKDGTIPFWEHGGHAIASDESIRITPSLRSKKGHVWSKNKLDKAHWEIEVLFRVAGRGRIGADGLAIWFTEDRMQEGPVFGSMDKWRGLAILMDSFDNDGQHNNPYIMAMLNDGTKEYDHNSDGSHQQLGGCLRDFRHKPFPVRIKVEYFQKALSLFVNLGLTQNKDDYELCMRAENVELPAEAYFGVSAATGGLADDHDVLAFLTHSLTPQETDTPAQPGVSDEEKQKYEKEFDEYWKKLEKAKEEYQKEHPDKATDPDIEDESKWFERQEERTLKQIFDGQNTIHMTVRELHRKLDEVIGRQERTLAQISVMSQGQIQGGQGQGQGGGQALNFDTIRRDEVNQVLTNQRDLVTNLRDLRTVVNDIQNKAHSIHSTQANQQLGTGGYDYTEMKTHLNNLQDNMRTLINRPSQVSPPKECPNVEVSCVTPIYFFLVMGAQIMLFIAYTVYKNSKETSAKKFY